MKSASQLLWEHFGKPMVDGVAKCQEQPCWVCGAKTSVGLPIKKWMGSNFVGQNKVRSPESTHVCAACVLATRGRPPDTLRMYSHLFEESGEYLKLNKGDKPKMRDFLRRRHGSQWFAAIADSGQKHIVPWTPVNQPETQRPVVLFEEALVTIPGPDGMGLIDDISALLTAGASKEDVSSGDYGTFAYERCAEEIAAFEDKWSRDRSSNWFVLAVWLAQRDEEAVQRRMDAEKAAKAAKKAQKAGTKKERHDLQSGKGKTQNTHGRGAARAAKSVPADTTGEHARALDDIAEQSPSGRANNEQPGGVGDGNGQNSPTRGRKLRLL